jgi:SAM-dependent methyltransferase
LDSWKEAGVAADFRRDGVRFSLVWDVLRDIVSARVVETGRQALDIVDVGGGTGGLAVPFAALGHNVTVVDPSPDALAAAQRRAAEAGARLTAVQGEAASLDSVAGPKAADLVICHNVLEYVDSPADAMTAIAAVLRPSATVSVLAANAVAAVLHRRPGRAVHRGPSAARDRRCRRDPAALHPARADRAHRGRRAARGGGAWAADLQRARARRAARRGRGRSRRNRGLARARGGRRGRTAAAGHRRSAAPARPPLTLMDDTGCHILHVDMDAFYASVEIRDRPELAGRAVIVGGTSGRGVVLSASYQARVFGVRSAMPVGRAQRMCPHAVFVAPRHRRYAEVSKEVMAIFGTVTPEAEPLALDEAFLDVAGALRRLGSPATIARHIRAQVAAQQGITCSVGVATTKFVAKIASARCKPDGLLVVSRAGTLDFLHALPVSALWGVGERTGEVLGPAGAAHGGGHRAHPAGHPAARARRRAGLAPGRARLGPGRAPGDAA